MIAGLALFGSFIVHALRDATPLIDVSLFRDRVMAAASMTTFTLGAAFFGSMLLMPLYYQVARGESALHAGLLIAPQGLGAAMMMPVSGLITDRFGAGRIVPFGLLIVTAGTIALTQISFDTSYYVLAAALFALGLGMGSTMMPAMSAAFSTMTRAAVPRATSALNVVQRVGGSIGVALLSVVLSQQLTSNLPVVAGHGAGLGAAQSLPPALHAKIAPIIADSFGTAFWWALGLVLLAFIPSLFLPRHGSAVQLDAMRAAEERAAELADVAMTEI